MLVGGSVHVMPMHSLLFRSASEALRGRTVFFTSLRRARVYLILSCGVVSATQDACLGGNKSLYTDSLQCLGGPVSTSLQIESALVLQPPSVAGDAANLLAVIIWWRVCERGSCGIDAVALDAIEEGRVFLGECQYASACLSPHRALRS